MTEVDVTTLRTRQRLIFGGGATAGVIGGIVVGLFGLVTAAARGQDLWTVLKGPAYPFLHERALAPGFALGPVVLGVLAQFAVSITWGILFAVVCFGFSRAATMAAGALWG